MVRGNNVLSVQPVAVIGIIWRFLLDKPNGRHAVSKYYEVHDYIVEGVCDVHQELCEMYLDW